MTPSPFTRLNTARLRADRRADLIRSAQHLAAWLLIALAALILLDAAWKTALALPDIAAQAATLKGM